MGKKIKGIMERSNRTGQISIAVTYPDGYTDNLWLDIVEHCAKSLTNNELAKIFDDCNNQLKKTDPKDVPLLFKGLMSELQQTIINRKVWIDIKD